uniref:Uncharacterized protein n=1 Tax=Heliothis virescens TaxID=7102 RepID=A0A2A4K7R1_HELVI
MAYTETSSVVLGHKTHAIEDWMSQRTWNLIEERRHLHIQLLATSDVAMREDLMLQYRLIRRKIYRSTRYDRRVWADTVADCAQRAANSGNLREMYKATKTLAGNRNQRKKKPLKDKRGQLIVTSEGQLQRWREHFEEIFRVPNDAVTATISAASLPTQYLDIDAATIGRTWSEIKREAQDRTRWRSTVDALCPN